MSGPIPYTMKIGVEVWRMPPRTQGSSYTAEDVKECNAIVKWLESISGISLATLHNHPFDHNPNPHLGTAPGPCIMISGQFTVWRVNPGDYIVLQPDGFKRSIDVVNKIDFQHDFTKA